ncbi:Ppp2r3c [Symbiodinium sp. KB8]|nr:Ppp2r3c [Symbiodinium sp. KB8]
MLSKTELSRFGSGMLTDVFVDRVFEEYQTYRDAETGEREMDYKTFLDFVLAMENKNTPQAIQYFWKLVDIHHTGCIDGFVINYFFRAIVKLLRAKSPDIASVDDDEIFDMVKSKTPGIITQQDLVQCRQGGTVLSMLIDATAFWLYDNRESLMMEQERIIGFSGFRGLGF